MKQLERNRREAEKEKANMHKELQRETQPNVSVTIFALLCVLYSWSCFFLDDALIGSAIMFYICL